MSALLLETLRKFSSAQNIVFSRNAEHKLICVQIIENGESCSGIGSPDDVSEHDFAAALFALLKGGAKTVAERAEHDRKRAETRKR